MTKNKYLFIAFLILGVVFRLWLIKLVPQPLLIGDQYDYQRFALGILSNGIFAESSRLYGYPLFLATVYKIFGINTSAVIFIQSILDAVTAVLIFAIGRRLFKSVTPAFVAFIIYLFNPFTTNFAGLILTEVLAVFLVVSMFFLLLGFLEKKDTKGAILLGLTAGFLPQVRPPFLFFALMIIIWLVIKVTKEIGVLKGIVIMALFCFPYLYNVAGNYIYFGEVNPLTVDNIFVREIYISLFVGRSPAHASTLVLNPPLYMFPREIKQIYEEYTPAPQNREERQEMAKKYLNLTIVEIAKDPVKFAVSHLQKMWFVWEKHFIFYYFEPENSFKDFLIYWGNVTLLALGVGGLIYWLNKTRNSKNHILFQFGVFSFLLLGYISVLHAFSLSEERYSLPGYPVIILFAGFFLWKLWLFAKANSDNRRN